MTNAHFKKQAGGKIMMELGMTLSRTDWNLFGG